MQAGWVLGGSCSAWRVDVVVVCVDVLVVEVNEEMRKWKSLKAFIICTSFYSLSVCLQCLLLFAIVKLTFQ